MIHPENGEVLRERVNDLAPAQPEYRPSAHRRALDERERITHHPTLGSL